MMDVNVVEQPPPHKDGGGERERTGGGVIWTKDKTGTRGNENVTKLRGVYSS